MKYSLKKVIFLVSIGVSKSGNDQEFEGGEGGEDGPDGDGESLLWEEYF